MDQIHEYLNQLLDKEIVILGLGREGISTYEFLRHYLPNKKVWLIDEKEKSKLLEYWRTQTKKAQNNANMHFSTHLEHDELMHPNNGVIIFKTPGIPPQSKLIAQTHKLPATVSSNSDLFFTIINLLNANYSQRKESATAEEKHTEEVEEKEKEDEKHPALENRIVTVGITGTKGKSTTTAVIHHLLKTAGIHSFLGGNIGIAPLSLIPEILEAIHNNTTSSPIFAVLELSCHQLNDMTHSPNYAIILNVTPEHLDYYESFAAYVQAKSHICMFQTESDFAILDSELYIPKKIAHLADATHLTFSYKRNISNSSIVYKGETIVNLDTLPFIGRHTITNTLPGVVLAKHLGIPNEVIAKGLQTFKTLAHRLELIEEKNGVTYYNDSLSTTPIATIAAIESFDNNPIILIAGGFDRGLEYGELAQTIVDHQIKHLILLPDTGELILEETKKRLTNNMGELGYTLVNSMQQAVRIAKEIAKPGYIVLMSPASASFNLFEDYQDRGNQFRKFVVAEN